MNAEGRAPDRSRARRDIARLATLGIEGYPPRTTRRLSLLNIVAALVIVCAATYIPAYAYYDYDGLAPVIWMIVPQIACVAATPWFHRFGDIAGPLWFVSVWLGFMTFFAYSLSSDSGVHFFFLPGAAAALLFFGIRHLWLGLLTAALALAVFLVAEFAFSTPAPYVRTDPWLLSMIRIYTLPAAYFFTFIGVFYSLRLATAAEDALEREYARSERLLENLLPESIAERLKAEPERIIADDLGQVTILFADIVDFTPRAASRPAPQVVAFLNTVFTAFDRLAETHGLEKIKTIGDAYMVAGGLPDPRPDHAKAVAEMALDMLAATETIGREAGERVAVRIGLHTGPAVAGVIGTRKFFYDVWGDTVNTAARMESHGLPGRIQVTAAAKAALEEDFRLESRGEVEIKGKGRIETWWLTGRRERKRPDAEPAAVVA